MRHIIAIPITTAIFLLINILAENTEQVQIMLLGAILYNVMSASIAQSKEE